MEKVLLIVQFETKLSMTGFVRLIQIIHYPFLDSRRRMTSAPGWFYGWMRRALT